MTDKALISVRGLKVHFPVKQGLFKRTVNYVKAVDGVDLDVARGETVGIVGESGCGKTTLGKAVMMLEKPTSGSVLYDMGSTMTDATKLKQNELLAIRKKVQMVFQDPYSAFNPMKTIRNSLEQPLIVHGVKSSAERLNIISDILSTVNIPVDYIERYPHELSGGQRQRICIARALTINPEVLVCDEAVSALDVSVQAQVLNLLRSIQQKKNMTYLFIAHDLSVVQYMSDRIAVMYLGRIVELADTNELYRHPMHPYTQALLSAIPLPVINSERKRIVLDGDVPSPINKPSGCPFHPRCRYATEKCRTVEPALVNDGCNHFVACHMVCEEKNIAPTGLMERE